MKDNAIFMAVKVGKESVEGNFKLYKGIAALNIVAVNPTKEELSALTGREITEEPEYTGKTDDGENQTRVVFYARTSPEAKVNNGINMLVPISFLLTESHRIGQSSGKHQIIDKYGRTAWATLEEVQSKSIPRYASGPANISADYRQAYQGEDSLIDFLIQWLNVPGPAVYKDKVWIMRDNPEDSEVSMDMPLLFKGDVSELKALVSLASNYIVKGAVGVRTVDTPNGTRQYQTVFTRKFVKNAVTDYSKLDAAIAEYQSTSQSAQNTEYSVQPLHEDIVEATVFSIPTDLPQEPAPAVTPWG